MPCYIERMPDGSTLHICGKLGPHCAAEGCLALGTHLCDFPVGDDGRTCDRPMCADHAREIGHDLHYCDAHLAMWREFRDSGGVARELGNVVPYASK